jgi:hypothetical protein
MPKLAMAIGVLLILQGPSFYFASSSRSMTALIPTFFGIPLLLLGLLGLNDAWRKHAMHVAMVVALVGMIAPLGRIAMQGLSASLAGVSLVLMLVLCGGFLVLGIKSFRDARRRQRESS